MLLDKSHMWIRRSTLSMGKWCQIMCSCIFKKIGILTNTRILVLRILDDKPKDLVNIVHASWNSSRKIFTPLEVASLIRLIVNLVLTTQWVNCTCVTPHDDILLAVKFNSITVLCSRRFKHLTDILTSKNMTIKNFYLSKSCKTVWNFSEKLNNTKTMRDELDLVTIMAKSPKAFRW